MLWFIALTVRLFLFIRWLLTPDPGKLLRVYSQPGKWYRLKFHLMKLIISMRQRKSKNEVTGVKEDLMTSQFGGDGGHRPVEDMEKKHEFPVGKKQAVDAVFFDASNSDGWYLTLGTAQRPNNIINLFFLVRIPDVGTFVDEDLPFDSNVTSVEDGSKTWRTQSGFIVKCDEPMKIWSVKFEGKLLPAPGKIVFENTGPIQKLPREDTVSAKLDLTWTSIGEHFDFDKMVSPTAIAHSLAIEPWSRALFDRLKASHQSHYEQFGRLQGKIEVSGNEYNVSMTSMRDHTISSYRDWHDIRRYIMIIYHLSDGTCIHTSVVSMPETVFSHLEFGYVVTPEGKAVPVDRVHFSLPNHGENKNFPRHFVYWFEAGGKRYDVEVELKETVSFKMGLKLTTQVDENMAEFTANGVKGYGFVELEYRIAPY